MPLSERQVQILNSGRLLVRKFIDDRCSTYAAALAFSSMLSIIPFLAILFAILKALDVHTTLTPVILSNVSAGSQEIVTRLLRYIHNTRVGSLGMVGLVTLLLSIMVTLDNVEDAFNQIWGLDRGKAYHHKVRDYLLVIFGIPLLIALAVTITTGLQNQWVMKWLFRLPGFGPAFLMLFRLVPYLSIWIALSCLYFFIPNTKVKPQSALIGALIAGTACQVTQWAYIHFQIGVSRTNAVYGTMSLLPVFMIWLYTGWIFVLAGMELVRQLQGGTLPTEGVTNCFDGKNSGTASNSPAPGED